MKKVTAENPIKFQLNGDTLLEIDAEGVIVQDHDAVILKDRLGKNIAVVEYEVSQAKVPDEEEAKVPDEEEAKVPDEEEAKVPDEEDNNNQ